MLLRTIRCDLPAMTLVLIALLCGACSSDIVPDQTPKPIDDQYFVSESASHTVTTLQSKGLLGVIASNLPATTRTAVDSTIKYDVDVKQFSYKTVTGLEKNVVASGIICLPRNVNFSKGLPILALLHGTIQDKEDAPSKKPLQSVNVVVASILASFGFAIVVPDYVGYGLTESEPHDYIHNSTARISADMIFALQEYCQSINMKLSNEVFITGYSQGGDVSLSTHAYLQQNASDKVTVYRSVSGAGPYDKVGFSQELFKQNRQIEYFPVYLWVFDTYKRLTPSLVDYKDVFNEAYYNAFSKINFDFSYGLINYLGTFQNDTFVTEGNLVGIPSDFINPTKCLKPSFRNAIINEEASVSELLQELRNNSIINWAPKSFVRLVHGTADDFVYPQNADTAYRRMTALGGTQVVSLHKVNGGNHSTTFINYLDYLAKDVIAMINTYK